MSTLVPPPQLATAAVVFFGHYGDVTRLAQQRGSSRQALYRQAHAVVLRLDDTRRSQQLTDLRQQRDQLQADHDALRQQLQDAVIFDDAQLDRFVATAQALGVSLSTTAALLRVLRGERTPSVAALGRRSRAAGRRAAAALAVLDEFSGARARQVAADEIFAGTKPILMTLEQQSLCWLGGRWADSRDARQWQLEFERLPQAEQVTGDRGQGLRKGLEEVNRRRRQAGQAPIADQSDHFHPLRRASQGLRQIRCQAKQALQQAERQQRAYDAAGQRGEPRTGAQGKALARAWQRAEAAFDRWSAQERVGQRLRVGLRLFTPAGELNTPPRAQAEVQAALAELEGPGRGRVQRGLGPEAFTFLERVQQQLAALPVEPELVRAAVRREGLQRNPTTRQGDDPAARALRGVWLAVTVVLALAGPAGVQAVRLVGEVLADAWRASSLVEGLNSVVRMHQGRQKRLTQGLLDLKRLHWNTHTFRAGRRKKSNPYGRLGLKLPPGDWWELLQRPPEQLRQELSALNPTA